MQGLSPEHPEASKHLHTEIPEGTPKGSPLQSEVPMVTSPHGETSDAPVVTTPLPQVERTNSLEEFHVTNTVTKTRSQSNKIKQM
jgi:hypothetical protein